MPVPSLVSARASLLLTCALLVPGCTTEEIPIDEHGSTCPEEQCGVNASVVNDLLFGENHLTPGRNDGNPNSGGARIVDFIFVDERPDALLLIANGTLEVQTDDGVYSGMDILGSRLLVEDTRDRSFIDVHFHDARMVDTWTDPRGQVEQYLLAYQHAERGEFVSVCSGASDLDDPAAWAVLLTGERYSLEERSVLGPGAGFFNIACNGSALFKMKMMGYEPRMMPGSPTTPDQRQATLKMLTGDYCGTGRSFTENGTPVQWRNADGTSFNSSQLSGAVEAYWDADGALCLDQPRLGDTDLQAVAAECASAGKTLPSCRDFAGPYEWVTHVP